MPPTRDDNLLNAITRRLREAFVPAAIWLYGSWAHGEPGPGGDVDLLVAAVESIESEPRP